MVAIKKVFETLDEDGNGTLEIQEFWKALCDLRLKFSQDECRHLFDTFDENDDGVLDYQELMNAIKADGFQ